MFQANQAWEAVHGNFGIPAGFDWVFGLLFSGLVGLVVVGGIRRIGAATSRIVPAMCGLYVLAALVVIIANLHEVPETFGLIFSGAFTDNAFFGGAVGVLVQGVKRAAFSNEAGLGSAAIAHAAAKTDEPVREGIVAMMGPFIDTIVVCTMTALVVIITGKYVEYEGTMTGVQLTSDAFETVLGFFPIVLTICVILFAYSTMISWCYYGERGWIYLMDHFQGAGHRTLIVFRLFFVFCVFVGTQTQIDSVVLFADLMILSMAFPNIVGSVILAPRVLEKVRDYWDRFQSGAMQPRS